MNPKVFDYIPNGDKSVIWEREPLELLAKNDQLNAYKHSGFWRPMDTLKDKNDLTSLWQKDEALWAVWV